MKARSLSAAAVAAALLIPAALALPEIGAWTPTDFPEYDWCDVTVNDFAFGSPTTGVFVGSCSSLYVTTTGGATWTRNEFTGDMGDLYAADFLTPNFGMAVGRNAIFQPLVYTTTNGGAAWSWSIFYIQDENGGGHEGSVTDVRIVSPTDAVGVASVWNGDGAIVRSTSGGASWSTVTWVPNRLFGLDFADDGLHGIAVGQLGSVHVTADGGKTWAAGDSGVILTLRDVAFASETEAYAVGELGVLLKTTDAGATWTRLASGAAVDLNAVDVVSPTDVRVAGDGGAILRSTDGGLTWLPEVAPTTVDLFALHFSSPATGFAGGKETILRYVGVDSGVLPGA